MTNISLCSQPVTNISLCSQPVTNYLRALLPTCGQLSFLLAKPIISADNDDDKTTKY